MLQVTCQSSIKPFDAGGILSQVRETDASGDNIPDWKRQLLARKAAEGAEKAFSRQRKVPSFVLCVLWTVR